MNSLMPNLKRFASSLVRPSAAILFSVAIFSGATAPQTASALTLLEEGVTYEVGSPGDETEFAGNILGNGSAGSWMVQFDSRPVETKALASAQIGNFVANTFTNLTLSWISLKNGVLASVAVTPGLTALSTLFSSPDNLVQSLKLSWTGSMAKAGFSVEVGVPAASVVTTPLPPSALLFLSALAGFAFLGWRRRAEY